MCRLGQLDGVVEGGLYSSLIGGNLGGPGDRDARERLGDEEAVPGVRLPCTVRMDVEGPNCCVDQFGQLDNARLGDLGGASGAIGGNSAVVACQVGALEVAQSGRAIARAGAADGYESEALDGAGDEFAVKTAADKDGNSMVAEAPRGGEQAPMPEGVNGWGRGVVAGKGAGIRDVFVAEGDAEATDNRARQAGHDGESKALLQGVWRWHEDEFTRPPYSVPVLGQQAPCAATSNVQVISMLLSSKRWKHFTAMALIGDGVMAVVHPRSDAVAWEGGPHIWRRMMRNLRDRPGLTRAIGAVQIIGGVWWAFHQEKED